MLRKVLIFLILITIGLVAIAYATLNVTPAPKTEIDEPTVAAAEQTAEDVRTGLEPALSPDTPPYQGMFFAFTVPVLVIGIPWILLQLVLIRYVQPRGKSCARRLFWRGSPHPL